MDIASMINSRPLTQLQTHYKKILIVLSSVTAIYVLNKFIYKKMFKKPKKESKKIKEFPTIDEIQKFIEDLPFDAIKANKNITLKDLLGELSEFSEDEDWKELIASVHDLYDDNTENIDDIAIDIPEIPDITDSVDKVLPLSLDSPDSFAESSKDDEMKSAKSEVKYDDQIDETPGTET